MSSMTTNSGPPSPPPSSVSTTFHPMRGSDGSAAAISRTRSRTAGQPDTCTARERTVVGYLGRQPAPTPVVDRRRHLRPDPVDRARDERLVGLVIPRGDHADRVGGVGEQPVGVVGLSDELPREILVEVGDERLELPARLRVAVHLVGVLARLPTHQHAAAALPVHRLEHERVGRRRRVEVGVDPRAASVPRVSAARSAA